MNIFLELYIYIHSTNILCCMLMNRNDFSWFRKILETFWESSVAPVDPSWKSLEIGSIGSVIAEAGARCQCPSMRNRTFLSRWKLSRLSQARWKNMPQLLAARRTWCTSWAPGPNMKRGNICSWHDWKLRPEGSKTESVLKKSWRAQGRSPHVCLHVIFHSDGWAWRKK